MLFQLTGIFSDEFWNKDERELLDQLNKTRQNINQQLKDFYLKPPMSELVPPPTRKKMSTELNKMSSKFAEHCFDKRKANKLVAMSLPDMFACMLADILIYRAKQDINFLYLSLQPPEKYYNESKDDDGFNYICTSIQGYDHMRLKKGCEDRSGAGIIKNNTKYFKYAFVADGISLAGGFSEKGAEAAGSALIYTLEYLLKTPLSELDIKKKLPKLLSNAWKTMIKTMWDKDSDIKNKATKNDAPDYSKFGTTLLAIIQDKNFTWCFRIGNGLYILTNDTEGTVWSELKDSNKDKARTSSIHNLENNPELSTSVIFYNDSVKYVLLASDGAEPGLANIKNDEGIPMYKDIEAVQKFIIEISKLSCDERKNRIVNIAESFAVGTSYQGASLDDASIVYVDFS
jgi:serine/threonine protein phosphatase PrpC